MSQKTVLITGANRGLGLGFVQNYLAKDATVIATCRSLEKAQELVGLQSQHSDQIHCYEMDVSQESSVRDTHASISKDHPSIWPSPSKKTDRYIWKIAAEWQVQSTQLPCLEA